MTWTRLNSGLAQWAPNMASTFIIAKWHVTEVTTYSAYELKDDGLHLIGSGDTYKEAKAIVEARELLNDQRD